jgi:L-serine dehydratase
MGNGRHQHDLGIRYGYRSNARREFGDLFQWLERKVSNMPDKRINSRPEDSAEDPLGSSLEDLVTQEIGSNLDRRAFLMRSALIGAMGVITGRRASAQIPASAEPKGVAGGPGNVELSPNLEVVKEQKGLC